MTVSVRGSVGHRRVRPLFAPLVLSRADEKSGIGMDSCHHTAGTRRGRLEVLWGRDDSPRRQMKVQYRHHTTHAASKVTD